MKKNLLTLLLILPFFSKAQLNISATGNLAQELERLFGPGVTIRPGSIQINGRNNAIGIYTNGSSIGFEQRHSSGLIISTGVALNASGGNTTNNLNSEVCPPTPWQDTDLSAAFNNQNFAEGTVIEVELQFGSPVFQLKNLIWASEENISTSNPDRIGIFLSQPGSSTAPPAIAQYTLISRVAPSFMAPISHEQLTQQASPNDPRTAFNRFSEPMYISWKVEPLRWYRLKIVVAASTNCADDSALLLPFGCMRVVGATLHNVPMVLCPGTRDNLAYSADPFVKGQNIYSAQNHWYYVELSNANGEFYPEELPLFPLPGPMPFRLNHGGYILGGRLTPDSAGTIPVIYPADLAPGSNYRIRIRGWDATPIPIPLPPDNLPLNGIFQSFGTPAQGGSRIVPNPNFRVWKEPQDTVRIGETLFLFAESPAPGATFLWRGPNGFSSTEQNPIIYYSTLEMRGEYTVTATVGGCTLQKNLMVYGSCDSPRVSISTTRTCVNGAPVEIRVTNARPGSITWTCPECIPQPGPNDEVARISWSTPGVKTIRVRAPAYPVGPSPNPQCRDLDRIFTVNVQVPPENFVIILSPSGGRYCINEEVRLVAAPHDVYRTGHIWNCSGCTPTPTTTYSPTPVRWATPGTKTISVRLNVIGCGTFTASTTINVLPSPRLQPSSTSERCGPGKVTFTVQTASPSIKYLLYTQSNSEEIVASGRDSVLETPPISTTTTFFLAAVDTVSGCSSITRQPIIARVNPFPAPPSLVGSNRTSLCGSGSRTLTVNASSTNATSFILYDENQNSIISRTSIPPYILHTDTVTVDNQTLSRKYYLEGINVATGCTSSTRTEIIVDFIPLPRVQITLSGRVCQRERITVSSVGTLSSEATYRWQFSGLGSDAYVSPMDFTRRGPFLVSWASRGTKTIILSVTDNGCSRTLSQTVNVFPLPDSRFTISRTSPRGFTCVGKQIQVQVDNPLPDALYTWSCSNCTAFEALNSIGPYNLSWENAGTKTITLRVISAEGCTSQIDTQFVTVNTVPRVRISVTQNVICENQTIQLSANFLNTPPLPNVIWTSCSGCRPTIEGSRNFEVGPTSWPVSGTKTIILRAENTGCPPADTSIRVVVNPNPAPPILRDTAVCGAGTYTLRARMGEPAGNFIYWYDRDNQNLPRLLGTRSSAPYALEVTLPFTKDFWAESVIESTGCKSSQANMRVTVNPLPPLPTLLDSARCGPGTLRLRVAPNRFYQFNWSNFPSITAPIIKRGEFLDIDVPTNQRYYVWATDLSTGCIGPIKEVVPIVHPVPQADFVFSRSSLCQDSIITIRFTGSAPAGSYYTWNCSGCDNVDPNAPLEGINRGTLRIRWAGWGIRTVSVVVETRPQGCRDTAQKAITVSPHPFASLRVRSVNLCINDSMLVEAAPIPFQATYRWNCSGCFPQPTLDETRKTVRWFTPGAKTISLVTQTPACGTAQAQTIVNVSELPVAEIQTQGIDRICAESLLPLSATPVNRAWYQWNCSGCGIAGNGSLVEPGPLQVSWGLPGTKTITLRVNTPGCQGAQNQKVIVVDSLPAPPTSDTLVVCGQGPVRLPIRGVPDFSIAAVRIYTVPQGGTALVTDFTPPYQFELFISTTTTFYTETQAFPPSGCFSPRSVFVVKVVNTLAEPTAAEVIRCGNGVVTFTARAGIPGGQRMCLYTTPTATTPIVCQEGSATQDFLLTSTPIATHTDFYLENQSTDRVGCISPRIQISARVIRVLPVPTFSDVVFCDSGRATVSVNVVPELRQNFIQLFDRPNGGLPLHSDIIPPFELQLPLVRTNTTFYVENTSLIGTCTSSVRVPLRVRINPSPKAPEVLAQRIVGCSSAFTFTVFVEQPGQLRVFDLNEELILQESIQAYPQLHQLVIPNVTTSSRYYLTLLDPANGCESVRSQVLTAEMITCPGPPIAQRQYICKPGSPVEIIPALTPPLGEGVRVYTQPQGGVPIAQSNIPPYRIWIPAVSTTTTYYLESYIGSCASCFRSPFEVWLDEALLPPTAPTVKRCGSGIVTFTITHSVPQSRTYIVYDAPGGNVITIINQPPYVFTTQVQTTTTFYLVGISLLGNCPSLPQPIVAEVLPPLGAPLVISKTRCDAGSVIFPVILTPPFGTAVALYTLPSGGLPIFWDNSPNYELTTPVITTNTIFFVEAYDELTGCRSSRIPVTAYIQKTPLLNSSAVQRCGSGSLTFSVELNLEGNYEVRLYTTPNASVPYSTTQVAPYRIQSPTQHVSVASYYLEAIHLQSGCITNRIVVEGRIIQRPGVPIISNDRICADTQPIFTAAMGTPAGDEIVLYTSAYENTPFSIANHFPYRLSAPPVLTQTVFYIASRLNAIECISERVAVQALPRPKAPIVETINICQPGPVTFTIAMQQPIGLQVSLYSSAMPDVALATDVEPPFILELPWVARTTTYYVAATNNFTGCSSSPVPAVVQLNERPGIPLVQTAYRCGPGPLTLSVAQGFPAGNIIRMLDAFEGGNEVSRAIAPVGYYYELSTPVVSESRYYYLESINTTTNCTSARRAVEILIETQPEVKLVHNGPICLGDTLRLTAECRAADYYIFEGPGGFRKQTAFQCCATRPNFSNNDEGVYSVTAILGRCTSNVATAMVPLVMNSYPRPILQTDVSCENEPYCCVCQNSALTFRVANNELYPQGSRFRWKSNVLDTTTAVPSLRLPVNWNTANLEIRVQVITPCSTEFSLPRTFCIRSAPRVPVVLQTQNGCQSGGRLNLTIENPEENVTYVWNGPCLTAAVGRSFSFTIGQNCSGIYTIEARTQSGCGISRRTIEVFTFPVPAQISASARESVLCVGQNIELRAELVPHLQYRWVGPNGFSSTVPNPVITAASSLASGTYQVYGYRANCTTAVTQVPIIVNSPIIGGAVSNNSPICAGQPLRLSTSGFASSVSFRWQGPQGFSSTLANPILTNTTPENSGIYTLVASVAGCPSLTYTTNVIVNSLPSEAALILASNSPLCVGQVLQITAPLVAGASYFWSGPNSFSSSQRTVVIPNATTAQSGTYRVSIEVPGCSVATASTTVKINTNPVATILGPNAICAGGILRLMAAEVPEASYEWRGPLNFQASGRIVERNNISREASGSYSLTVTVPGCPSQTQIHTVEVNSLLQNPVILSNIPVCAGETLSISVSNAPADLNYNWQGPQGFSATGSNFKLPNVAPNQAGLYTLSVTSAGCAPFRTTVNVVVNSPPSLPRISLPSALCEGSSYTFSVENVEPNVNYSWRKPNGEVVNEQKLLLSNIRLIDAGIYQVCAQRAGCNPICNTSTLVVSQLPGQIQIFHNGPICSGQSLQLSATSISGATYRWLGPRGFVAESISATRANITLADSGSYSLNVTVPGCGVFSQSVRISVVGLSGLIALSNSPLCVGQTLRLNTNFNSSNSNSTISYRWQGPQGFFSIEAAPVLPAVTVARRGVYSVTAQLANCPAERATVNVLIDEPLDEIRTSQNSPLCSGANLQINTLVPQENVQYEWQGPAGFRSTFPSVFIANATVRNAGVYTLTVHTQNRGCPSREVRIPIEVRPGIQQPACVSTAATVQVGDTIYLCKGEVSTPGLVYEWRGPNNFFSRGDIVDVRIFSAKITDSGTYTLTIISPGCSSASFSKQVIVQESNCIPPAVVNVFPLTSTQVSIEWSGVLGAVCYIVSYGKLSESESRWFEQPVLAPSNRLSIGNLQPGERYGVKVRTNCSSCELTAGILSPYSATRVFTTQLNTKEHQSFTNYRQVIIYPNPAKEILQVRLENTKLGGAIKLKIRDSIGKEIITFAPYEVHPEEEVVEIPLHLLNISAGMYYLEVEMETQKQVLPFIIQR
ncbi:MAG: hypothetical protein NZ576_06905 [Bacteroidia bacterium]|nr:hypothetical protein [Bacteroidia bacterium]